MEHLVKEFQCPGCVNGSDTSCGSYNYNSMEQRCVSHVLGTQVGIGNNIALGLPKGFNKPGFTEDLRARNKINIRLWIKGTYPEWDHLNVPIWKLEKDEFLFVRTYAPRINMGWVDVIEDGNSELCPTAMNVGEFIDKID